MILYRCPGDVLVHNSVDPVRTRDRSNLAIHKVRPGAQTRSIRLWRIHGQTDTARLSRVDVELRIRAGKGIDEGGVAIDDFLAAPAVEAEVGRGRRTERLAGESLLQVVGEGSGGGGSGEGYEGGGESGDVVGEHCDLLFCFERMRREIDELLDDIALTLPL